MHTNVTRLIPCRIYTRYELANTSLRYSIPSDKFSLKPGERHSNYVWYCDCAEGSSDVEDLRADVNGHRHRNTLPIGGVRDEIWFRQKALAREILAPPFAELVSKTAQPFVATMSETISPRASFFGWESTRRRRRARELPSPCWIKH